jgi:fatty-acyl-CoA synthase
MKSAAQRREELSARHPEWLVRTISGQLGAVVQQHPERALVIGSGRSYTYSEIAIWSQRLASGMIALGIAPGDRVAIDMANFPEFVALKFAIARAGAVCVPCNFLLRGGELAYVLQQSGAVMLVTMDVFRGQDYLADLQRPATLRDVVVFATGEVAADPGDYLSLQSLADAATPQSDAELARRENAADGNSLSDIIYTSGTTGQSKGVMLTHDMVLRAAYSSALTRAFEDGRRILFAMPMYHVFGYVECLIAATFVGGAIIPQAVFDPQEMLDLAESEKASEMVCVPVMTAKLIETARTRGFDSVALRTMFNSGGINPPSIWDEIDEILKPQETVTAYGMTETTASTTCTLPEDGKERLLTTNGGLKLAGIAGDPDIGGRVAEYKTIDPVTGADLPPGEEGELVVRGPVVSRGYYNKPEETADAFTPDGWLHTGDVGRISSDGYLVLTGRIKETYRCNGEMVMPKEIEDIFADHPELEQALLVGVPDPRVGEVGCLCIVPKAGARPEPETLVAMCAKRLASFKVPRHVLILSAAEIPLTITGRPQKFKLAKLAADRLTIQQGETQ